MTVMLLLTWRYSLHSALKEFIEPLRTNDHRTDFFAVYRKESEDFDRDYVRKYDEDLNTSLIFVSRQLPLCAQDSDVGLGQAGLFSAVSSAFIIDVQSKLEPDPNDMTAAYMRILIHAVNGSLYPDADPSAAIWTGPPSRIVTVQSLLYASLATSLFSAFLAMLGKQWINRYLRNRGGSTADKSRERQRKLDGLQRWHFHFAIESLPAMLQMALLLLGCALSLYLWTISRAVAGVAIGVTLFGITSYIFFTLAATFSYNCPYETPYTPVIRVLVSHSHTALIPLVAPLAGASRRFGKKLRQFARKNRSGMRSVMNSFCSAPNAQRETVEVPLATVASPVKIFDNFTFDWERCEADARCISWMLSSTTDNDVILSTVHFAADTVWYPATAVTLSPRDLVDLFFDCISDRRVIPGKSEQALATGITLVSILSIRLGMEPGGDDLRGLCDGLVADLERLPSSEPMFFLVTWAIVFVARSPTGMPDYEGTMEAAIDRVPKHLPTMFKVWLARVVLQTTWRLRRLQYGVTTAGSGVSFCARLAAGDELVPPVFKINHILIMILSLGLEMDPQDLYAPNNEYVTLYLSTWDIVSPGVIGT